MSTMEPVGETTDQEVARYEWLDRYIGELKWADDTSIAMRGLVAGNLRGLFGAMFRSPEVRQMFAPPARTPDARSTDSRAEAAAVIGEIAAERQRQINVEGWTPDHDDRHDDAAMACAAGCYAMAAALPPSDHKPEPWPWARDWWKPATPRRMLVKAGALIVAEIERIDREAAKLTTAPHTADETLVDGGAT